LELSCTITETFNEEKPVWPSYFLENSDSHVGCIVDYSFAFFSALGLCKDVLHIVDYSYVWWLHSYLCSSMEYLSKFMGIGTVNDCLNARLFCVCSYLFIFLSFLCVNYFLRPLTRAWLVLCFLSGYLSFIQMHAS
jgi:hypothetical protein